MSETVLVQTLAKVSFNVGKEKVSPVEDKCENIVFFKAQKSNYCIKKQVTDDIND